jgi:hypothetical protein
MVSLAADDDADPSAVGEVASQNGILKSMLKLFSFSSMTPGTNKQHECLYQACLFSLI